MKRSCSRSCSAHRYKKKMPQEHEALKVKKETNFKKMKSELLITNCLGSDKARAISCSANGVLAFASGDRIFLFDIVLEKFRSVLYAAGDVTSLKISKDSNYLISAQVNKVTVWDLKLEECVFHFLHHEVPVTCVDLIPGDEKVISADENGNLYFTKLETKESEKLTPIENNKITVISCGPKYVAVGYKDGKIVVIDYDHNKVQEFSSSHGTPVDEICWSPASAINQIASLNNGKITIWNISSQNDKYKEIVAAKKTFDRSTQYKTLIWPESRPSILLCGKSDGTIQYWPIEEPDKHAHFVNPTDQSKIIHQSKITALSYYNSIIISVSEDKINLSSTSTFQIIRSFPVLSSSVIAIACSPFQRGYYALSLSDCQVLLWNSMNGETSPIKTLENITSLDWHPSRQNWIAFGRENGTVGYINTKSKSIQNFHHSIHEKVVTAVEWGLPFGENAKNRPLRHYSLYSCSGGKIAVNDPRDMSSPCIDIEDIIGRRTMSMEDIPVQRVCFSWNNQRDILAIGSSDSSIELFQAKTFLLLGKIYCKDPPVMLSWHHSLSVASVRSSPCIMWLAVGFSTHEVFVYKLPIDVNSNSMTRWSNDKDNMYVEYVTKHSCDIRSVEWSPFAEGILLTASSDGIVQICNVLNKTPAMTVAKHRGDIYFADWYPFEGEKIISSGTDCTLYCWNMTDETASMNPSQGSELGNKVVNEKVWFPVLQNKEKVDTTTKEYEEIEIMAALCPTAIQNDFRFQKEAAKHFHLNYLCSKNGAVDLLLKEANNHCDKNNWEFGYSMHAWMGNMSQVVGVASEKKNLDNWIIGVAPGVSEEAWRKSIKAYAHQLEKSEDIFTAATFYIVQGEIEKAVGLFLEYECFEEAVALARTRLSSAEPLLLKCLRLWAMNSEKEGNIELAIKCYLGAGDMAKAASLLETLDVPNASMLAADIHIKENNIEYMKLHVFTKLMHYLHKSEWELAENLGAKLSHLKPLVPLMHLIVDEFKSSLAMRKSEVINNLCVSRQFQDQPILNHMSSMWMEGWKNNRIDEEKLTYRYLEILAEMNHTLKTSNECLYAVCIHLCLSVQALACLRVDLAVQHLISAFKISWLPHNSALALFLVEVLFPNGPENIAGLFPNYPGITKYLDCLQRPFSAWYVLAVLGNYANNMERKVNARELSKEASPDKTRKGKGKRKRRKSVETETYFVEYEEECQLSLENLHRLLELVFQTPAPSKSSPVPSKSSEPGTSLSTRIKDVLKRLWGMVEQKASSSAGSGDQCSNAKQPLTLKHLARGKLSPESRLADSATSSEQVTKQIKDIVLQALTHTISSTGKRVPEESRDSPDYPEPKDTNKKRELILAQKLYPDPRIVMALLEQMCETKESDSNWNQLKEFINSCQKSIYRVHYYRWEHY